MEGNNNNTNLSENLAQEINAELDGLYADIKAELYKEVETYLNSAGIRIFERNYSPINDVMEVLNKFNANKETYEAEKTRIANRYSVEVATSKTKVLDMDYKLEVDSLMEDLDKVEEHERLYKEKEIARLQSTPEYKEARALAFNNLNMLKGIELPPDVAMDLVSPFIRTADIKSLKLAELMVGKDTYSGKLINRTSFNIQQDIKNSSISHHVKSAKDFIKTGEMTPSLLKLFHDYNKGR